MVALTSYYEPVKTSKNHRFSFIFSRLLSQINLLPVDIEVANRDESTKTSDDLIPHNGGPIYSGEQTGDVVKWKIPLLGSDKTYTWSATNTFTDEMITGPTGIDQNEWLIGGAGLGWPPGDYEIKIQVSGMAPIQFDQVIGWRTNETIIVGQILPYEHRSVTESEKDLLKNVLAYNVVKKFNDLVPSWLTLGLLAEFTLHDKNHSICTSDSLLIHR